MRRESLVAIGIALLTIGGWAGESRAEGKRDPQARKIDVLKPAALDPALLAMVEVRVSVRFLEDGRMVISRKWSNRKERGPARATGAAVARAPVPGSGASRPGR